MALTPNFTASVDFATKTYLHLEDTSTGSDGAIIYRLIRLELFDGTYLLLNGATTTNTTTAEFNWDYSVSFIDLNVLNIDYAFAIAVEWLNISGTVLYTKLLDFPINTNAQEFNLKLTKYGASVDLTKDYNYTLNKMRLVVGIDNSNNAISLGSDIASSQAALNDCKKLIDNPKVFF